MGTVQSYRDLVVWRKAMALAEAVYVCCRKLPKEETYGLACQMRSAAVSIAANIAEGHARSNTGEYKQFIGIARGSLAELETEMALAERVGYVNGSEASKVMALCEEVGKLLSGLHKALVHKMNA